MTREQLNTDLMINMLTSLNINNLLLLNNSKFNRAEMKATKDAIDVMIEKTQTLSDKSTELDDLENQDDYK